MTAPFATLTYIGGPTILVEVDGLRFLTDPTFDDEGARHASATASYVLTKTQSPAVGIAQLGALDAVLLSHDHHADNLDTRGRGLLARVPRVLTTREGAARLGGNADGLAPWETRRLRGGGGNGVRVTATPARHGPEGGDRGPVVGFVLEPLDDAASAAIYVTGDTVWYEGIAEVARQFDVGVVIAFVGAARVAVAGPAPLTLTAADAVALAGAFPRAIIVPVHFEGWAHFTEGRADVQAAFVAAGLASRLRWPVPGVAMPVDRIARERPRVGADSSETARAHSVPEPS